VDRPIVPYEPTWLDRVFKKELGSLPAREQDTCIECLAELLAGLKSCKHPIQDPSLQRRHPTSYKGVIHVLGGHLVEYRLTKTMRVIACYFEERADVLLVTATIKHDHERMKRVLRNHGRYLSQYPQDGQ
jgi:hypothetical protein